MGKRMDGRTDRQIARWMDGGMDGLREWEEGELGRRAKLSQKPSAVSVKVNFALEQTMKVRRGSRGRTLFFL